jgi:hypothetical protein
MKEVFGGMPAAELVFVIAGLLYFLRLKRVDNLGAYRIPSETRILIPSVPVNLQATRDDLV